MVSGGGMQVVVRCDSEAWLVGGYLELGDGKRLGGGEQGMRREFLGLSVGGGWRGGWFAR